MPHIAIALFCLLLELMFWPPTANAEDWCQPKEAPHINIHTSTDQVSFDFSLSEKQLNKFSVSTVNPYASNIITDVGGLMKGGIEANMQMSFGTMTDRGAGQMCYWHDTIDVSLHIKPTIYIANEFPAGSCMHTAIMEHEQKHVTVDREIVNKYAKLIGEAFQSDITRYRVFGPIPISQGDAMAQQLKHRMESIFKTYTAQMSAERKQRQQQVDNINEYERVNHLCPKEKK